MTHELSVYKGNLSCLVLIKVVVSFKTTCQDKVSRNPSLPWWEGLVGLCVPIKPFINLRSGLCKKRKVDSWLGVDVSVSQ